MEYTKRQKEIINAAMELINTSGIQKFTMKSLAEYIGISEPGIYRHFKSKLEILMSILTSVGEELHNFENKNDIYEKGTIEDIGLMLQFQMKKFMIKPSLASIVFAEEIFQNELQLSNKVLSIMTNRCKLIERVIFMEQKKGVIRIDISAAVLTNMIMGSVRLLVKKWNLSGNKYNLSDEYSSNWNALSLIMKV